MMDDRELADALQRVAATLTPEEPCRSWTVFIEWSDLNGQSCTYNYGASDCDTYEKAVRQVVGYITNMPEDWRIHRAWAARATDIVMMDGWRFNRTPQFQVR